MNPVLTQIEQEIEAKVSPQNKAMYDRTVIAGMKVMNDPKTHANMELIKNPQSREDPVGTISKGVAGLMWVLYKEGTRGQDMNRPLQEGEIMVGLIPEVFIMAGTTLMLKVFDLCERGLGMQITNDIIAETTKELTYALFAKLGITQDMLQQAINAGSEQINEHVSKQGGA